MYRNSLLLSALLLACNANANLVLTAVVDGPLSGGVPKAIELYVQEDIYDLSLYGVGAANNGGGSDGQEFTFPVMSVSAGDYLYLATESQGFANFFGFEPDFTHGTAVSINGDDAIEVYFNGEVIDLFGDINVDGSGQNWEYLDGWAVRTSGSTSSSTFVLSEWQLSGANALDGASDNQTASNPVPLKFYTGGGSGNGGNGGNKDIPELVLISSVQGTTETQTANSFGETDVSPIIDTDVTIEAVVVGDFQGNDTDTGRELNGFFLQEEALDEDGNNASSEGIFVYDNNFGVDVQLGDRVSVSGTVDQYFGETQLSAITRVEVLESNVLAEVNVASIYLPAASLTQSQSGKYQPDLEAYEGMLVRFEQSLQINEQFQLDRFNEIKLVAGERPWQFTQRFLPDAAAYDAHLQEIGARTITYDDGLNIQNANVSNLPGFEDYRESSAMRMGDTVVGLTGVLDYKWAGNSASGATWRVRAHQNNTNVFTSNEKGNSSNPRPLEAPQVMGNLKIVSFNVLNFFSTLDQSGVETAAGHDPRGADSAEEFERQLQKTLNAILAIDSDVLGLIEIENEFDPINDGSTAIEVLVNALNSEIGSEVYDYVYPGSQFVGSDAIAVAFIYKNTAVKMTKDTLPALLDDSVAATLPGFSGRNFSIDPLFNGPSTNRVSLAVSFTHLESQQDFTVVANHFKSKGSSGLSDSASPYFDQLDGAGFWNLRRLHAAQAVNEWLQTSPTGIQDEDIVILGDLNAYAMEEPLQYLLNAGYHNVESAESYSYVFDGQIGTLDYLLLSPSLYEKLQDVALWHINADEADALDYNLDFGKSTEYFDAATATRNSDHDPVIVGLGLYAQLTSLDDILQMLLSAYDNGEINGAGRHSLIRYLNVLRFYAVLQRANYYEENAKTVILCRAIHYASKRSDGESSPSDLINGVGVSELNSLLAKAYNENSCQSAR